LALLTACGSGETSRLLEWWTWSSSNRNPEIYAATLNDQFTVYKFHSGKKQRVNIILSMQSQRVRYKMARKISRAAL
jgi:hypothetical protein